MFETVTASHYTNGNDDDDDDAEVDDLRPLLLMMDIGSCASAEKHTGVNCVTASMGDVVIEHYPRIGELLELRASPVSVGRTSLDIAVVVVAHGRCNASNNNGDDDDDDDDSVATAVASTERVCEAFFTYVTTRGPNGEKRFAPPLQPARDDNSNGNGNRSVSWERTLAHFRKQLIRSEQALVERHRQSLLKQQHQQQQQQKQQPQHRTHPRSSRSGGGVVFESSEVVLPSHLNHMQHLFGGVVMGWMCKSVLAGCVKATRWPLSKFRIRSIQRVDFPAGADVSDHVVFQPAITAVFDNGRSAEFVVRVGKRKILVVEQQQHQRQQQQRNDDDNDYEAIMNVGYFYVTGVSSYHSERDKHYTDGTHTHTDPDTTTNQKGAPRTKLSSKVAPFAGLLNKAAARG